jgi:hypothetical protein
LPLQKPVRLINEGFLACGGGVRYNSIPVAGWAGGPDLRLQWWRNDGGGNFVMHEIDRGKKGHLGARLFDLDRDGNLDIVSTAWDAYKDLHLWRAD